jgi:hypothetical protein
MSLRTVAAIVLLVLLIVCVILARLAFRRWKYPPKRRRRDSDPSWLQYRRQWLADLKRLRRGLRFPSPDQKARHMRFRKRFLADPVAYVKGVGQDIAELRLKALNAQH